MARQVTQRFLWAAAILDLPSAVRGPVDMPPCSLHRFLPRMTCIWHALPRRVFAPHNGRRGLYRRIADMMYNTLNTVLIIPHVARACARLVVAQHETRMISVPMVHSL